MAKDKNGWYALQRSIQDGDIWNLDEPFGKRAAYIDLLLMANYEDKNFIPRHSNDVIPIHIGQLATSMESLSKRWKWSRKKTIAYINQLELLGLVKVKSYSWGTALTLVEYGKSGNQGTAPDTASDTTPDTAHDTAPDTTQGMSVDTTPDTASDTRLKKDKNRNNNNKDKEIKQSAKRSGFCLWEGEPE